MGSTEHKPELSLPITGRSEMTLAAVDRVTVAYMAQRAVPGAAIAITRGGKLVYARGFGYGDWENKEAIEPDSLFRIAGVSKAITEATVVQLIQRGHLGLNDNVFQVLKSKSVREPDKDIDPRIYDITIAHLLNHLSGWEQKRANGDVIFRQEKMATTFGAAVPPSTEQIINYAMSQPLSHEPGSVFSYSNLGYYLLGRVVEELTEQSYEKYVQQNILQPLGIIDMRLALSQLSGRAGNEVKYYIANDTKNFTTTMPGKSNQFVPAQYGMWSLASMDACDGWIASAPDLVRFASSFEYSEQFAALKGEPMRSRFHPGYCQTGYLPGSASVIVISRKLPDTCWAVLFNSNSALPYEFNERLSKTLETISAWPEYDLFEHFLKNNN